MYLNCCCCAAAVRTTGPAIAAALTPATTITTRNVVVIAPPPDGDCTTQELRSVNDSRVASLAVLISLHDDAIVVVDVDDAIAGPRVGGGDRRVDQRIDRRRADCRHERIPDAEADRAGLGRHQRTRPGSGNPSSAASASAGPLEGGHDDRSRSLAAQPDAHENLIDFNRPLGSAVGELRKRAL